MSRRRLPHLRDGAAMWRRLACRRPAVGLVAGLLAIALGSALVVALLLADGPSSDVVAALALVAFGVIWVAVMTRRPAG